MDERRPFTRADAVRAGVSDRVLRTSRYRRIFRGVYIRAEVAPTDRERMEGALALHPEGAWLSHRTAAAWCGVVVPESPLVHVSVLRAEDRRWQPGITASDLQAGLARTRDYWSPGARYAATFVRDRVRSAMETRLRLLIVLAGLPEPEVNVEIRSADGDVLVELDLAYPRHRVAVEYDGAHHRVDTPTWRRDLRRSELVDTLDWHVVHVTALDIYGTPAQTIERIRAAASRCGLRLPLPRPGWELHFPGRARAG